MKNADINYPDNEHSCNALHIAVESGKIDIAKCLIDKGACINAKDKSNSSALHKAS